MTVKSAATHDALGTISGSYAVQTYRLRIHQTCPRHASPFSRGNEYSVPCLNDPLAASVGGACRIGPWRYQCTVPTLNYGAESLGGRGTQKARHTATVDQTLRGRLLCHPPARVAFRQSGHQHSVSASLFSIDTTQIRLLLISVHLNRLKQSEIFYSIPEPERQLMPNTKVYPFL